MRLRFMSSPTSLLTDHLICESEAEAKTLRLFSFGVQKLDKPCQLKVVESVINASCLFEHAQTDDREAVDVIIR